MSITAIPNKGLAFDLEEYERLMTSRNGPDFWYYENQRLLCSRLDPFLPRMEMQNDGLSVQASVIVDGEELLCNSEPINPDLSNVPAGEFEALHAALVSLVEDAKNPLADPNIRTLVDTLLIPLPAKAPELYRLYRDGHKNRLAVIWGLGKRDTNGELDMEAMVKITDFNLAIPEKIGKKGGKGWIGVLLGLAAVGLGAYFLFGSGGDNSGTNSAAAPGTATDQSAVGDTSATQAPAETQTAQQGSVPGQTSTPSAPTTPAGGATTPAAPTTPAGGATTPADATTPAGG
ncbi:MAG TPA: hypothetical protein H9862_05520, partial [Candidatus Akkermansia intestinigallinarum]|nr:hypothetical protein [Candidatus Akkermansia intestinigallinarum]